MGGAGYGGGGDRSTPQSFLQSVPQGDLGSCPAHSRPAGSQLFQRWRYFITSVLEAGSLWPTYTPSLPSPRPKPLLSSCSGARLVWLWAQTVKRLPAMQETRVPCPDLEKGLATHSSILAWEIPRSLAGYIQSVGSQSIAHDWASDTFAFDWLYGISKVSRLITWPR